MDELIGRFIFPKIDDCIKNHGIDSNGKAKGKEMYEYATSLAPPAYFLSYNHNKIYPIIASSSSPLTLECIGHVVTVKGKLKCYHQIECIILLSIEILKYNSDTIQSNTTFSLSCELKDSSKNITGLLFAYSSIIALDDSAGPTGSNE